MATIEKHERNEAAMTAYDVALTLEIHAELASGAVEELAEQLLEALERDAADVALGPAVGGRLSPPVIEVEFDVEASGPSDLQQKVAAVVRLVETALAETPVELAQASQTRSADRDLVCA